MGLLVQSKLYKWVLRKWRTLHLEQFSIFRRVTPATLISKKRKFQLHQNSNLLDGVCRTGYKRL